MKYNTKNIDDDTSEESEEIDDSKAEIRRVFLSEGYDAAKKAVIKQFRNPLITNFLLFISSLIAIFVGIWLIFNFLAILGLAMLSFF